MQVLQQRKYEFRPEDYDWVRAQVRRHAGINLSAAKQDLIYNRLVRRLRALNLASFAEYRARVEIEGGEMGEIINAITTNVTAFFREPHHFETLSQLVTRRPIEAGERPRLRIWSAGCSTGEEPYSIAITLFETLGPALGDWDVKVLATDIDTRVLEVAQSGVYPLDRIEQVPVARRDRWFQRGTGEHAGSCRVRPEVGQILTFRPLNLIEAWPVHGPFDVIFCRNVLIYFERALQTRIIRQFASLLRPGGLLFLGHSESAGEAASLFTNVGHTTHERHR